MPKRERKIPIQIYLSEDEDYILVQKQKASGLKSKSSFLRHLILYGYVYDIDYSELQEYNAALARIGNSLNQIAKRMNATGNINIDYQLQRTSDMRLVIESTKTNAGTRKLPMT